MPISTLPLEAQALIATARPTTTGSWRWIDFKSASKRKQQLPVEGMSGNQKYLPTTSSII